jgi:hypothetical protein
MVVWVAMIPISIVTGWVTTVTYVQEDLDKQKQAPVEDAVVDRILERTQVEPA